MLRQSADLNSFHPESAVFSAVRPLPDCDRAAFLDETCAGDQALLRRLEALLRANEAVGAVRGC